ncbi:phosphotransferase [Rhodobacteraceae bacterium PA1-206B]
MSREDRKAAFLSRAGWAGARRAHLAGDASSRSYERLARDGEAAVLMDAPPGCADDPADFIRIGAHLAGLGLSPPRILARDLEAGLLLIEDLGDDLFALVSAARPEMELPLYLEATGVLTRLQAAPAPTGLPDPSAAEWAQSVRIAVEIYARGVRGADVPAEGIETALARALAAHADGPRVLILRDYHAGNLLWLPERAGLARVGLLDFQSGQMGQPEYDLVSLLQDARRDVAPETEAVALAAFARGRGRSVESLRPAYATLGALRALRILGVFARLCLRDGKDGYLGHMPRVWGQLMRNLSHPALAELRRECLAVLPEPTPEVIAHLRRTGRKTGAMPLMIFAAGFGTRMGALTRDRPKPLIKVAGRTLLDRALDLGDAAGAAPVVVNSHYLGGQIREHLKGRPVAISHEEEILETGGGLRAALPLLGPEGIAVMTLNPDVVWRGPNPLSLLAAHWDPARMAALLLVKARAGLPGRKGRADFTLSPEDRIRRAGGEEGFVYLGAQILQTGALREVSEQAFSLNRVWDRMIAEGRAFALTYPGEWCDVGTPEGLAEAEALLAEPADG